MFEIAELGSRLSKADYKARGPELWAELLDVQQQLRQAPFPVIVLFGGVDAAGRGETVNLLNEWMDPRWVTTRAWGEPSEEERERPKRDCGPTWPLTRCGAPRTPCTGEAAPPASRFLGEASA